MEFLESLSKALASRGVDRVFGVPGTQTVPFLEALRRQKIEFMLAAHEGGAAFMANGYARATGKVGVLSTIGGPGFTNALTGLAEAWQDSVPLLHIVNAPKRGPGGGFHLQAIDQSGMAAPVTKACLRISASGDADTVVERAIRIALEGEPGPVLLELVLESDSEGEWGAQHEWDVATGSPIPDWDELRGHWRGADRPLFYLGQGAFEAVDLVRTVVDRVRVPVLTTPSGRGVLPESHPLAMGFDPLRGHLDLANRLLSKSDLIVGIACKLSHNGSAGFSLEFPPDRFVHIDRAATTLGSHYEALMEIPSDARMALEVLTGVDRDTSAWDAVSIAELREAFRAPVKDPTEPTIAGKGASEFFEWLGRSLPHDAVLVTDSGQHQVMTRRYHQVEAVRGLIVPSDFQSMGFGVPAAMGAKLGTPGRPVVALVGDGGFLMTGMEVAGAVREGLPICFIVFNDGHLNQIRLQQLSQRGRATGVDVGTVGLETFAEAVGAGYVAYDPASPPDLTRVLRDGRPTVLEVPVGDSPALGGIVLKRRLKESARSVMGRNRLQTLKRWFLALASLSESFPYRVLHTTSGR